MRGEPEFVQITMKMRDIVNICEDCHFKVSHRHRGAGRFFYPFGNQSDNGDLKKSISFQENEEDCSENQQKSN
jgi:hypothetical protein